MKKKILALALTLAMVLSLLPATALATEGVTEETQADTQVEQEDEGTPSTNPDDPDASETVIVPEAGKAAIGKKTYNSVKDAVEAAKSGDTIILGEGNYTLYKVPSEGKTKGKDLTFIGQGAEKTGWNIGAPVPDPANFGTEYNGDYSFDGAGTVTFKDMTLRSGAADYLGFIRADKTIVKDCIINGKTFYWGYISAEFIHTTFNCPPGDYALWTYSSPTMTFDNCTFNSSGKVINVYTDYDADKHDITVNFKNCTVNSTALESLSVMNINDSNMGSFKYVINFSGVNTVNGIKADGIESTDGSHASTAYNTENKKKTSAQATCSKLFEFNMKYGNGNSGKTIVNMDTKPVWKDGRMISHAIDTANDKYTDGYKDNAFTTTYGSWTWDQSKNKLVRTVTKTCQYCGREVTSTEYKDLNLEVGFKVRMNPKSGSEPDKICKDTETLDVDLDIYTSAYIRPYLVVDGNVYKPPKTTTWGEHIYYTYEFKDFKDDAQQSAALPFDSEVIYNQDNTGNTAPTSTIVIDKLSHERLNNGTPGAGNYYTLTIKAYQSATSGAETPSTDTCLGTVTAKLHVRMTGFALPVLDWLESYTWDDDRYGIDRNLEQIYPTADDLITDYLKSYKKTYGEDATAKKELKNIPVSWAVTEGTTYSAKPGAVNSLTWTAELDKAPDYAKWTIPDGFECSRAIQFQNPFAVTFMDGENVLKTILVKKGNTAAQTDYPDLPTKPYYNSTWDKEPGFTVEKNTDVHVVYKPIPYGITYHLNDGTNSPDNPHTYTVEDTFTLKAPTKQGYAFTGWTYGQQNEPNKNVTIPVGTTGRLEFEAHWVETVLITATAGDNGTITPSGAVAVPKGEAQTFQITPNDGYHIQDVKVDRESVGAVKEYTFKDVTEPHTIYATFARNSSGSRPSTPTVTIPDDVPTGLNGKDHYAYVVGYPDGMVYPQKNITRAEVATIFFRLLKDETREANMTKSNGYNDMKDGAWYTCAVSTLSKMGIIKGYEDGSFKPDASISRAEFAAIAARFDPDGDTTPATFSDVSSHWAKDEISIAANHGWIKGYEDGSFKPDQKITRAETMTLVNRVLKRLPETKDDLHKDMKTWPDNQKESAWFYLAVQEATNSHYQKLKKDGTHETWESMRETRDWAALEK